MHLRSKTKSISLGALMVLSLVLCANSYAAEGGEGKKHGPPAEAIEACAELAVDQVCEFVSRRGDAISGICSTAPRDEGTLACKSENHEHRGRPDEGDRTGY